MSTSQVLQHLYTLDTSSPDLLRYLYYLIQNDDEEQYVSSLQGSELTRLVDFLDGALDVIPITDDVSRRCLHKLQAICGRHKILPSSYNISGDLTIIDDDPVASGGFSDVWEGTYDGKKVCIKRLRITQQTRQVIEKAFCKEAVMWKRLKHPNIVGFIGVMRNPLRLVSEWMPKGTLTEYLSENPGANRIGLLLDVAEGLTFLHAIYTTHGDLKGPNVLIDQTGHACLTDFGFTSVVRGVNSVLVTEVQGYSARWAAPEVLGNGDKNTREADVFAFGMVVIEVFTGRHPFSEFTPLVAVSKIIAGERPDRPQEPGLIDLVWNMTLHCWTQDPAQRPIMASVVGILRECSRLCTPNLHLLTPTPPAVSVYDAESTTSVPQISVDGKTTPSKPSGTFIDREPTFTSDSYGPKPLKLAPDLDVIEAFGKETEPGVLAAKQKVELLKYYENLFFKAGEYIDMDLLHENRSLIHAGKFLRQPDTGFEWNEWKELFVLLFDNYLVMTKSKEKDGITKYQVYRRPIPLDLLTLTTFTDPPTRRGGGLLPFGGSNKREMDGQAQNSSSPAASTSPEAVNDGRAVYPCTIHHNCRLGGLYTLFAETSQARLEWKAKLEEAIGLRKVVQESNKVFEVGTLSMDTFYAPTLLANAGPSWNNDGNFTSKVTCSVPFSTPDGRALVAIGCTEGVWIGFRHDSRSMRRVLHLRMVTQCAMLEDFGIFLVLADKSLFAYHIEALVPSSPGAANTSQTPQKLSGNKDVQFFAVGNLDGRTLVIYMRKKNHDSLFRAFEPVIGKINEKSKPQPSIGSRFSLRSQRSEWFRVYRDFFLPSDSYDLLFLKTRIVILCSKGFEIMDLTNSESFTDPLMEDPRLESLARRAESCRPMGMFSLSNKDEILLCYDEFGLYVDKHASRPMGTVEWEGTAERVAWHPPYVLLFDSHFIEIRHIETGRLVQIISGNDMRCSWDGRGTSQAISEGALDEGVSQEPRVHGVMEMEMPPLGKIGETAQHVFELIPTAPLSFRISGSSLSPSHAS
ncbi:CNH domain-containing protein [Thelephora terrestris]|uniref:CNH domain-containing protein n=1 Tax=Thelephora terrestris TaxID=56493 RepID=A0A9P6L246_9AGAM|nr:CNH domain-containing protein [Thelephora terrestris]